MKLLLTMLLLSTGFASAQPFELKPNDVIALTGGSNIERTRFNGYLQTSLIASKPELKIKVRNFGWEGDTVFEQWRDGGNYQNLDEKRAAAEKRISAETGNDSWRQQRDWRQQLKEVGATVVIAQFGQMESLNGVEKLPQFIEAYEKLIAEFADEGRRVVLVAPVPFGHEVSEANHKNLAAYSKAIGELASKKSLRFIPLDSFIILSTAYTINGYQLDDAGHQTMARLIVGGLGLKGVPNRTPLSDDEITAFWLQRDPSGKLLKASEAGQAPKLNRLYLLQRQVLEFERLWFDYWRPMNWAFLTGDRTNVPYSKDWKDSTKRIFPQEMQDFLPLLDQAEKNIWAAIEGRPLTPIGVRSSIPVEPPTAKPQSPEEELASFQIKDGIAEKLIATHADGIVYPIQKRCHQSG
ncbi:MAG: hypothetical protein JNG86_13615, partial [Verrucomicrobiaceae bacterium]|nr:hypothetical protein [Verrucomicrobiaceae bacterium]